MISKEDLLYLSVRIENSNNNQVLGSGIWWQPSSDSEFVYVFTAAHVCTVDHIRISYIDSNQQNLFLEVNKNDIALHKDAKFEDGEPPVNDIAVIRCRRLDLQGGLLKSYKFQNLDILYNEKDIVFRGFPDILNTPGMWVYSNKEVNAKFENYDQIYKRITYSINNPLNTVERDEEVTGLSGAGIFVNKQNCLLFLGIHTNGVGINSGLSTFAGISGELIYEICKEKQWDEPVFVDSISGNLSDCVDNFIEEINNDELIEIMLDLINDDYKDVIKCNFCGNSKYCEDNTEPHNCISFRNNLLITLSILKYLNNSVDFKKPVINLDSRRIPVKYVCSDGERHINRMKIERMIYSLKTDYLMKNPVENNTLIIWNTKKSTKGETVCNSQKFKNIIGDIKGELRNDPGFDIIKGYNQPRELTLININDLLNSIEKDDLEKLKDLIEDIS